MTQSQVAEVADVAQETLSRIERNKLAASLDLARRLADALEVKVDDLLSARRLPPRRGLRPAEARLLAVVRRLDEPQVDEVARALRLLLGLGVTLADQKHGVQGHASKKE
ncbi:MAG: helix-turn-helix transcriptional regulator [Labilithrix sp.]|nr:helix-turn-helix transcriptional regulator [Labilithrix sp.]